MKEVNVRRVAIRPVGRHLLAEGGESVRAAPRGRCVVVDEPAQEVGDVSRLRLARPRENGRTSRRQPELVRAALVLVRTVVAIGERNIKRVPNHRYVRDGRMYG